jgi:hypothetical protein
LHSLYAKIVACNSYSLCRHCNLHASITYTSDFCGIIRDESLHSTTGCDVVLLNVCADDDISLEINMAKTSIQISKALRPGFIL